MTLPTEKDSDTLLDSAPKIFKKSIVLTIDRGLIFNEENPIWDGQFGTWHMGPPPGGGLSEIHAIAVDSYPLDWRLNISSVAN